MEKQNEYLNMASAYLGYRENNTWELSSAMEKIVGKEGFISYPGKFRVELTNSEHKVFDILSKKVASIMRELFSFTESTHATFNDDGELRFRVYLESHNHRQEARINGMKSPQKQVRALFKLLQPTLPTNYNYEGCLHSVIHTLREIDQLNSKRLVAKGAYYLSALPEHILTASVSGYGWKSCYSPGGIRSTIPYHLSRDQSALVWFFVPNGAEMVACPEYGIAATLPKRWRAFVYLGTDGSLKVDDDVYPSHPKALADMVHTLAANISLEDNPCEVEGVFDDVWLSDDLQIPISFKLSYNTPFFDYFAGEFWCRECYDTLEIDDYDSLVCSVCRNDNLAKCDRCGDTHDMTYSILEVNSSSKKNKENYDPTEFCAGCF